MKFFVTGVSGQLGHDVINEIDARGYECIGSDLSDAYSGIKDGSHVTLCPYVQLDITDSEKVSEVIRDIWPDVIIHCAAWTDVDGAEDNVETAFMINSRGTWNLAQAARETGCSFVYVSTDYVFDGKGTEAWKPDCTDLHPLNVYGASKLEGERAVVSLLQKYFIVRTSWVFGLSGRNFIKTMLKAGKAHNSVRVINDQIGTPTYTKDLAVLLTDMALSDKYGYYHATNSESEKDGYISWYDLAKEIYRQTDYSTEVIPVTAEEYGLSKAVRPLNSRLDKSKLIEQGFTSLPDWKDALNRYLKELNIEEL